MKRVFDKIKANAKSFYGLLPQSKVRNDGTFRLDRGGNWTDGFYVGVLNLAYLLSGDGEFRQLAKDYDDFFALRIQNNEKINQENEFLPLDHDVGMIFLPVAGFGYEEEKTAFYRDMLLRAADILAERFNPKGEFIRAWDTWSWDTDPAFIEEKKGKVIIDSMMNIPLLFKASKLTGDAHYYDIAIRHARTMAKHIVRPDGSTFHTFNFDYKTGKPIGGKTQQGYSDSSCWSRGQAWAVYGFAMAYRDTGCREFLEISLKTGAYFMEHLNSVDLPCWDFAAADQLFAPWDSSAALICASGFLELFELTGQVQYKENALRLLSAVEHFCLTTDYPRCQPLILHGCSGTVYSESTPNLLENTTIDQALVYADYFYLECKLKLSDCKRRIF